MDVATLFLVGGGGGDEDECCWGAISELEHPGFHLEAL